MNSLFVKFPSTPYLTPMPKCHLRNDKVLTTTERDAFLKKELVIEEKIDGANLGISFDISGNLQIQNRGGYLLPPFENQWKKLPEWLSLRTDSLFEVLADTYLLFGEWCYAQHSIFYSSLPDWFLGFDIYDRRTGLFLSTPRRDQLFCQLNICQVPELKRGYFTGEDFATLLTTSKFGNALAEGLYLRHDSDGWLERRAKLVRPEFAQSMEQHWSRGDISRNKLKSEAIN